MFEACCSVKGSRSCRGKNCKSTNLRSFDRLVYYLKEMRNRSRWLTQFVCLLSLSPPLLSSSLILLPVSVEADINAHPVSFLSDARKAGTILVKDSETLAQGFKRTFSRDVYVHFVGVWDTVSSVGAIIPRSLPFAQGTNYIRNFRQALALDERRARFAEQPYIYDETEPPFVEQSGTYFALPPDPCSVKELWFAG